MGRYAPQIDLDINLKYDNIYAMRIQKPEWAKFQVSAFSFQIRASIGGHRENGIWG
jgi:hypothetical protein